MDRWLHEAQKRYHLVILNYVITSNHVHLLGYGGEDRGIASRAMQRVAGRTAQEDNRRKNRKGAFWEDRYYATVVDSDDHLARCLACIDVNIVRAGVVAHPDKWTRDCYQELHNPPKRYRLLARERLNSLLSIDEEAFKSTLLGWLEEALSSSSFRNADWSESAAVGSKKFVDQIKGNSDPEPSAERFGFWCVNLARAAWGL